MLSFKMWWYSQNGQTSGPFPEEQLKDLLRSGELDGEQFVCGEGSSGGGPAVGRLTLRVLLALLLGIGLAAAARAQTYTFTDLAGSAGGPGPFDGTGSNALFYNPTGVMVDGADNLYVADTGNRTNLLAAVLGSPIAAPVTALAEPERDLDRERIWWWNHMRAGVGGRVPAGQRLHAFQQLQETKKSELAGMSASVPWLSIGPAPTLGGQIVGTPLPPARVSGRIHDIAVDPSDALHWLIATPGGGVWATNDAGDTWRPLTDDQPLLCVGRVAFAPSDSRVIYAGMNSVGNTGGILKSRDGGATWRLTATEQFARWLFSFQALKVDPLNPDTVVAATLEFFGPSASTGVVRSTDGGLTWVQTLPGDATDLAVDRTNFDRQYAGIGTIHDQSLNGLYRSVDGGRSWSSITGPWVNTLATYEPVKIAIAPSDVNTLYVCIGDRSCYRTRNAWDTVPTFAPLPTNGRGDEHPKPEELLVDQSDPSVLYLASFPYLWKFDGTTWLNRTDTTHVDQTALAWANSRLVLANDGGIWSSIDGTVTWTNHNATLAIAQFYAGFLHPTMPNVMLAGSQDNGAQKRTAAGEWQWIFPGDDFDSAISTAHPDTDWLVSYYYLNLERTRDGGQTFQRATDGIDPTGASFYTKFAKCPANDDVFIAGSRKLWKSTDFFSGAIPAWSANSPDVGQTITAVAFAPSDTTCQTYAFATDGGIIHGTTDGGATWKDLDPLDTVYNFAVNALAFDPVDANTLRVALGFSPDAHVFKTSNALAATPTWVGAGPSIDISHNALAIDASRPQHVYAGTDLGLFETIDGGTSWRHIGPESGLPYVTVTDIRINDRTRQVVAFTYGRGAFATSIDFAAPPLAAPDVWATASGLTSVGVQWNAVPGAASYQVYRSDGSGYILIGTVAGTMYIDNAVAANKAYAYRLRALDGGTNSSAYGTPDVATVVVFTDQFLYRKAIRAVHLTELRAAANAMRALAGLGPASFTDAAITTTAVRAIHVTELRSAMNEALTRIGARAYSFTDPMLTPGNIITATHWMELRSATR
jgi:photosystem II stability/assembly factor-like uncharacterized protein